MMEGVLLLSRVETATYDSQPEPVRLADLCRRIVDEVESATSQRCPLVLRLGPLPESVRADRTLLRHLLTNLLSNAVKYSPPGSAVEIEAECPDTTARFTIRDHGIGIPRDDQARLFEAFHRGANVGETPGTGLGLLIVKRCVDLLGGDIHIESEVGRGTTVEVSLSVTRSGGEAIPPARIQSSVTAPSAAAKS
jgi:signal transduction histidine kinase